MWMMVGLGFVAAAAAMAMWIGPARELIIKLGTMKDWARRENAELYARILQPISSSSGAKISGGKRVTLALRADLSGFSPIVQGMQRDAKALDRKAHIAMWPLGLYIVAFAGWWILSRG
jgi:hypothetical protein